MTDDAALIERLRDIAKQSHVFGGWSDIAGEAADALSRLDSACAGGCQFERIAEESARHISQAYEDGQRDALSRLTTLPLPKEIAGLMERIDAELAGVELPDRKGKVLREPQDALRALAQENERLKVGIAFGNDLLPALQQRIRELEVERDQANEALSNIGLNWNALKEGSAMQLRAIRAKTFEECANVAEAFPTRLLAMWDRPGGPPGNGYVDVNGQAYIASAIRALAHASTPFDKGSGAQRDESKTESGE